LTAGQGDVHQLIGRADRLGHQGRVRVHDREIEHIHDPRQITLRARRDQEGLHLSIMMRAGNALCGGRPDTASFAVSQTP
jgi:hypothetical protein